MSMTIDHHDNPFDNPAAWIREEVLTDIRLDGVALADAVAVAVEILVEALEGYRLAVQRQEPRAAVSDPAAISITTCNTCPIHARSQSIAQPATLAIANGPDWTIALCVSSNRLAVVDVGRVA